MAIISEEKILKYYRELKVINCYKALEWKINEEHTYEIEKDILILLKFIFELTSTWFEHYIKDYFEKEYKYDWVKVTWWLNDEWIDVQWALWNKHTLIQCKKYNYNQDHIKDKEMLKFSRDTRKYKHKKNILNNTSLYFITTTRINQEARTLAEKNNIEIRDYKKILKINKYLDIENYIKKHKDNRELVTGINTKEILDKKYFKQGFWKIVWVIPYYIRKIFHINYEIDYNLVEYYHPEKK